jgi:hypothetical protein
MTEFGRTNLEIFQYPNWEEEFQADPDYKLTFELVLGYVDAMLGADNTQFDTLGVDTLDELWNICSDFILRKFGVDDFQKIPREQGNGWHLAAKALNLLMDRMASSPLGMVMTSHIKEDEVESKIDSSISKLYRPTMDKRAWEWVQQKVDFVFCLDYVGTDRILMIRGGSKVRTSVSPAGKFLDPNGEPLNMILMPTDPQLGYETLLAGFNNELWDYGRMKQAEKEAEKAKAAAKLAAAKAK